MTHSEVVTWLVGFTLDQYTRNENDLIHHNKMNAHKNNKNISTTTSLIVAKMFVCNQMTTFPNWWRQIQSEYVPDATPHYT